MPAMPQNEAGWRIEPPVSVPVAPIANPADTAAADPPEDPPGTSALPGGDQGLVTGPKALLIVGGAHGELVQIGLAQEHCAVAQQVGGDRALVGGDKMAEDAAGGGGAYAGRAE